jgi:hypothetical protein
VWAETPLAALCSGLVETYQSFPGEIHPAGICLERSINGLTQMPDIKRVGQSNRRAGEWQLAMAAVERLVEKFSSQPITPHLGPANAAPFRDATSMKWADLQCHELKPDGMKSTLHAHRAVAQSRRPQYLLKMNQRQHESCLWRLPSPSEPSLQEALIDPSGSIET